MDTTKDKTALILGSNGKFGRHAAKAFEARGWTVIRFTRGQDDLTAMAARAGVIVMGWHPPSYEMWEAELLPPHRQVIAAALAADATVILPGNVYNFGPDAPRGWSDSTPQLAQNPLGRLRIELEEMYRQAGVKTILLRAGDFIDTIASKNWFDRFIVPKAQKGYITYPGALDQPHAWAYLPDLAKAAVHLAERREGLARFEEVPFAGHTLTGTELAKAIGRTLGQDVEARQMSWLIFKLVRPVMPGLKGVFEMRYLWSLPHHLDGEKLSRLCPEFRATPVEVALAQALSGALGDQITAPAAYSAA